MSEAMDLNRQAPLVVRNPTFVWRLTSRYVLVRSTLGSDTNTTSELRGAGALVWIAAEFPTALSELAEVCELDHDIVSQTVNVLLVDDILLPVTA